MSRDALLVTFDFWDTLVDGSLEPAMEERRGALVAEFLARPPEEVGAAYRAAYDKFISHYERHTQTLPPLFRLDLLYDALGVGGSRAERERLYEAVIEDFVANAPPFLPGARECVAELAAVAELGVVSDTGFMAGRALARVLERGGLLKFFSHFSFSDETGFAKPDPRTFAVVQRAKAWRRGVHVGDKEERDVAGAHAAGMSAVLVADGVASSSADATVSDMHEAARAVRALLS